nr:zinc dependent phospholipase C family protein [Solitalea koreensis]
MIFPLVVLSFPYLQPWGFFGHTQINRMAVFTLPEELFGFYKKNIDYITVHAVDPDKRRYIDPKEGARHYIDLDLYETGESLPQQWYQAVSCFTVDTLEARGISPWNIEFTYRKLVKAFRDKDNDRILHYSADLGHYVADACVPLHTTSNYNGQQSGQTGIHAFWESRLPELFVSDYDFLVGKAQYVSDPLKETWIILHESHAAVDSVLSIEKELSKSISSDQKFAPIVRNGIMTTNYSDDFSKVYHQRLGGMVERRMRRAIFAIGSFWYSAWVEAGQPELNSEKKLIVSSDSLKQTQLKMLGRQEDSGSRP